MKRYVIISVITITTLSFLSGCARTTFENKIDETPFNATVSGIPTTRNYAPMIPAEIPMPIKTIEIYDKNQNKRIEADVLSLSSKDIRDRLTSTEILISVEKHDTNGTLTYLGAGGKVAKGNYRVTFDYANFTNQEIKIDNEDKISAIGRIGVGLRITADLETFEDGVDLGGLLQIGLATQNKKVSGWLNFNVYGMSNDKVAFTIPSQSNLDVTSIQQSFNAAATVRVLFGLEETKLEPYLLGVAGIKPADAKKALSAATKKLAR
jgi:hypothetical protein